MGQSVRRVALLVGLAAVYYLTAKLGLRFAYINSSVTTIWPPAGIALAAFVLLGYRVWPAIFGGAFFANFTTTGFVLPSVGIAVGNTVEGLLAAYLVNRFARGGRVFDRVRDILRFTVLGALVSPIVAASIGVTSLALSGLVPVVDAPRVWLTWWLGDAVGDIVIAPALILWIGVKPSPRWSRKQLVEALALIVITALVTFAQFGGVFPAQHYPLTVLVWPVMIWVAFRFSPREAATAMLIVSAIAIPRTLAGYGPFSAYATNESLVLLQVWTGITAVTSLVLAAAVVAREAVSPEALSEHVGRHLARFKRPRRVLFVEALPKGGIHICSGTHGVGVIRKLDAAHKERGQILVTAPILGRPEQVLAGAVGVVVGGPADVVERLQPVFDALAPPAGGFVHAGPSGAGHFTKMVHNGIEYGLMQAYAEGCQLLHASTYDFDIGAIAELWMHGSVIRSWLLELTARALGANRDLSGIAAHVEDSGEGRWALQEGIDRAVPMPVLTAALFTRFRSREDDPFSERLLAALRQQFGRAGHSVTCARGSFSVSRKALPLFPELPPSGSAVELWELWERRSGLSSANVAGFTS